METSIRAWVANAARERQRRSAVPQETRPDTIAWPDSGETPMPWRRHPEPGTRGGSLGASTPEQEAARFELELRGLSPNANSGDAYNDTLARIASGDPLAPSQSVPDLGPAVNLLGSWRSAHFNTSNAGINGHGYVPAVGDDMLLARAIFSETGNIPGDAQAIGWTMVNRVRRPGYGNTLHDVLHQRMQYEFLPEGGNGHPLGSRQWQLSEHPEAMDPVARASWDRSVAAARSILSGHGTDPSDGATHFFASDQFVPGDPGTIPYRFFRDRVRSGRFRQSPFHSASPGRIRNYFFVDTRGSP
jgi:hypothetical protein